MNAIDLTAKVAVVTGAAQGIGFAVAQRLIHSGATVACWDVNANAAEKAARSLGENAISFGCDISDAQSIESAKSNTLSKLGQIDILVNSAGLAGPNAPVDEYPDDEWRRIIDVNLTGTYLVNKAIVQTMKAAGYGRIVNIASVAGKEGNPNACAYSASKAGVIGFTKSLGKELAGHDIAVNCVTPAAARTPIFDQMSQEHIDYMLSKIPRNRFLEVEEAAAMIAWLVSAENSFTTGAVFDLSGGRATY